MNTQEPYGISGARLVRREDRPFVTEAVFTNDPPEMVQRCLNCQMSGCEHGTLEHNYNAAVSFNNQQALNFQKMCETCMGLKEDA